MLGTDLTRLEVPEARPGHNPILEACIIALFLLVLAPLDLQGRDTDPLQSIAKALMILVLVKGN